MDDRAAISWIGDRFVNPEQTVILPEPCNNDFVDRGRADAPVAMR
jgi:hypothetical protein